MSEEGDGGVEVVSGVEAVRAAILAAFETIVAEGYHASPADVYPNFIEPTDGDVYPNFIEPTDGADQMVGGGSDRGGGENGEIGGGAMGDSLVLRELEVDEDVEVGGAGGGLARVGCSAIGIVDEEDGEGYEGGDRDVKQHQQRQEQQQRQEEADRATVDSAHSTRHDGSQWITACRMEMCAARDWVAGEDALRALNESTSKGRVLGQDGHEGYEGGEQDMDREGGYGMHLSGYGGGEGGYGGGSIMGGGGGDCSMGSSGGNGGTFGALQGGVQVAALRDALDQCRLLPERLLWRSMSTAIGRAWHGALLVLRLRSCFGRDAWAEKTADLSADRFADRWGEGGGGGDGGDGNDVGGDWNADGSQEDAAVPTSDPMRHDTEAKVARSQFTVNMDDGDGDGTNTSNNGTRKQPPPTTSTTSFTGGPGGTSSKLRMTWMNQIVKRAEAAEEDARRGLYVTALSESGGGTTKIHYIFSVAKYLH